MKNQLLFTCKNSQYPKMIHDDTMFNRWSNVIAFLVRITTQKISTYTKIAETVRYIGIMNSTIKIEH